jgi:hypothetical protein
MWTADATLISARGEMQAGFIEVLGLSTNVGAAMARSFASGTPEGRSPSTGRRGFSFSKVC